MVFSQAHQSLAGIIASTSQLGRPFTKFVFLIQDFARWSTSPRKRTMSHLHFVLEQTVPHKRPNFARYPTLLSRVALICDPCVWPNLAKQTVRTLLSPMEISRFVGYGPLVAPIPYLLFLFSLFCVLNDPKVKSVKQRTWIITACVWISLMAALAFLEHTEYGKYAMEALVVGLAPLVDFLPSLQPLDRFSQRASQALRLPVRFLPSCLFFAELGYHTALICRNVYRGWQNSQSQNVETEQQRATPEPAAQRNDRLTEGEAQRIETLQECTANFEQQLQESDIIMRRHYTAIQEHLAKGDRHCANMQRMLDEYNEAKRQWELNNAASPSILTPVPSDLQLDEEGNGTERDGEQDDDSPNNQQPLADDSQSSTAYTETQPLADLLSQQSNDASDNGEENAGQGRLPPEHPQPPVEESQSSTGPAENLSLADEESGSELAMGEDGEQSHKSFEHHRPSVTGMSPTSPVEGQSLLDELAQLSEESDYEEKVEEDGGGSDDDNDHGDGDQGSPQATLQTAESLSRAVGSEGEEEEEEEQSLPQITSYQIADDSYSEYSHEEDEKGHSSPHSNQSDESSQGADDPEDSPQMAHQSAQSSHRAPFPLGGNRPQSRQDTDIEDLEDAQYFADDSDYHAMAEGMPGFLEPAYWKPKEEREEHEDKEPRAQMSRSRELTSMAGEQFGDEYVTSQEVEDFRQEGQQEDEDENGKLPPDHLKTLAEAQSFTTEADKQHELRNFKTFMDEGKAEEQAQQQAQKDRVDELKTLHQSQAFVNEEDERHNQRFLDRFVEAGKAEEQAQQASQPDLEAMSNAQSFAANDEIVQTAQDVEKFVDEGKAEQQRERQAQADRNEELKGLQLSQAFVEEGDELHHARSLDQFIEQGDAEKRAQRQAQKDRADVLKALQQAQSGVSKEEEQDHIASALAFAEQAAAERQDASDVLRGAAHAQYFGDETLSNEGEHHDDDDDDDDDDEDEHDTTAEDTGANSSSTHDDDGDDDSRGGGGGGGGGGGLETIHEKHENGDEDDVDISDAEPAYTLSHARDHYDAALDREQYWERREE
ncbi:hypothetical protein JOL62DRAFT_608454 [Phyllosticta paracitricarpa]|uniref:Uncharacterized protein n=1 Tax=Phyllosticta paracitricarpa TaxID=2016321 RepID=A0ABR1NK32_9PEZI